MLQFFAPITKINEAKRTIRGILALEQVDKDGEIMDYATSKPHFVAWSKEVHKNSGGKSVGNLREMHDTKAVGKFTELTFNDEERQVEFEAEVVDDDSWKKVTKGVLNGVSIGGSYVKKWKDTTAKAKRYTVKPCEGSLVDNPNMYGATFEVVKSDGASEVRKFVGNKEVAQVWECVHKVHHYPSKSDALHCELDEESTVEKTVEDELEFQNEGTEVRKSLYDVSSLASTISSLKYINPGDNNKVRFNKALKNLITVLSEMVKDERAEIDVAKVKEGDKAMSKVVKKVKEKAAEEEEEVDPKEVENEEEEEESDDNEQDVEKVVTGALKKFFRGPALKKVVADTIKEQMDEALSEMREDIEAVASALTGVKKAPAPTKAVTKVIDGKKKTEEPVKKVKKSETEEAPVKTSDRRELLSVMKAAQAKPVILRDEEPEEEESEEEVEE